MLRRVALVRTHVSEEIGASLIRVIRIGELSTTLAVTSNRRTLRRNTRATWLNIPEDTILHSHRRENLKSYIYAVFWDVTTRGSCENHRIGGTQRLHHEGDTLMMEALRYSETSILTRTKHRNNPEDSILQSTNYVLVMSEFLAANPEVRVRFPALPDFSE
jgi:hypothetical protein